MFNWLKNILTIKKENRKSVPDCPKIPPPRTTTSVAHNPVAECKKEDESDFATSALVGMVTNNALIGGIVGGSMAGGIVGDMINDGCINSCSDSPCSDFDSSCSDFGD